MALPFYVAGNFSTMERVNISRYTLLVLFIAAAFFMIPFGWLEPGEMDLGGDSSRLYFYDPIRYLSSQSLFSISQSAFGGENQSYYAIPFFLLLALFKSILHSPTILISSFHGFSLSLAFIFCYLVVREILYREYLENSNRGVVEIASILVGLYYNLGPFPILGWGYVILPHNQVFLNPLMFFLLLRFFLTHNMRYLLLALLTTFIFSPNFSFVGAPSFFSFYPLALTFLFIYTKYIRRVSIPVRKLMVGVVLFLLIQSFHLLPQIVGLLSPGSPIHEVVFSKEGKIGRGLGYFSAVAPNIKVSLSWLHQPQLIKLNWFSWIFTIFPAIMVAGFIWNRKKVYLLTGVFFLMALFFFSANITNIGFNIYTTLFYIPGFSMFRTSYGQWQWVYLFFYTLLLGQALAVLVTQMKQWYKYMFGVSLVILLVATSWPFINGTLTDTTHWQSKDIKSHVKMDPQYEEALSYIRSLPADGKILSLPLTDHGYQVVKGENDAAYIGPSTITYLTNKSEFMGFDEFGIFGPIFLEAARDKDYLALQDMLAMFNIKYIFYNSDPYIYGDNFPAFPYRHVPKFLPPNQEEYKVFIENLEVEKKADFGDKYHIYEIKDKEYLPHIYAAKRTAYWSDNLVNLHTPLSFYPQDKRVAFYDDIKIFGRNEHIFDDILLKAQNKHQIFYFFKTKDFPKFVSPFVSQKPSSFIYPLVVLREKKDLEGFSTIDDEYIDRSTYFAEKRINELVKWTEIPVRKNVERIADLADAWQEPKLWEFRRYIEYNSWEITLARYQQAIEKLIGELEAENQSPYSSITNKVALKNILIEHRDKLRGALRQDSSRSIEEKRYLFSLVDEMFADIFTGLNLTLPDDWIIPYEVGNPLKDGRYEVYVSRDDIKNLEIALDIDKMRLFPKSSEEGDWIRFDDIVVENKSSLPITVTVNKMPDFVAQTKWKTAEQTMQTIVEGAEFETDRQNETKEDSATFTVFTITYSYLANTSGLIRDISEWEQDKIYIISFDYLTYNQNFLLALYERGGTKKNPYVSQTYSEELRSKEWKKFKAAVLSKEDAQSAFVQISKGQDDIQDQAYAEGIKKFEIRDLSVVQVPNPLIVLKRVVQPQEASTPQITFKKINPTKYKVSVSGATDPYNLVLSERFNPRWKIFSVNKANEARTLKGWISRVLGRIATGIVRAQNIVISSDAGKGSLTSYFDSDIIEGMHENVFLDQNTFETFGYDPIAEATHLPANGYANGWYITTKEVQNEQDYELIIEMTSQKLFYGSVLLSIGGLFLLVFMLLKSFIKIPK